MNKIFYKYRLVIIIGVILVSSIAALILKDGNAKDFFQGVTTGAALVAFGLSISEPRSREKIMKHFLKND